MRYDPEEERYKILSDLIKEQTETLLKAGPEACKEYLISLGIYNKDGTIAKEYGGE